MVIIYDEINKQIKVVRNIEYRKWLKNIDLLNRSAMASNVNAFEQDPVKWENFDFSDPAKQKDLERFVNGLNALLNDKNVRKVD